MAEPDKKVSVPLGSKFVLEWSADVRTHVTNIYDVVKDDGTPDVVPHEGPKPQKNPKKPGAPKEVALKLHVTKDGDPYYYKQGVPAPNHRVEGAKWVFTSFFVAREEGVYLFTVDLPTGTTLTKEVTVEKAKPLSEKRQLMMDVVNLWMPSSTADQRPPALEGAQRAEVLDALKKRCGWTEDRIPGLMELSGWVGTPEKIKGMRGTSCGSVLGKLLALWGSNFDGLPESHPKYEAGSAREFGIRDDEHREDPVGSGNWKVYKGPDAKKGAKTLLYYQDASAAFQETPPRMPEPGDILVLRDGIDTQALGHVCVLVSASADVWRTADGGGGYKAGGVQSAAVGDRLVSYTKADDKHPKGRPIMVSVTDQKEKLVDGWVVLDRVPNVQFTADGKRKAPAAAAVPAG
jgi:hypothetical protein